MQVKRRLREVTAAEIRAVAHDFFRPDRLNLVLVSASATNKSVTKILGANAEPLPSPVSR